MKFGKSLSTQVEQALPEWRDKFLSYKELKKRLKVIHHTNTNGGRSGEITSTNKRPRLYRDAGAGEPQLIRDKTREEMDFIWVLEEEIKKLNAFFVEKEEEYIIRLKELQDRAAKAKESEKGLMRVRKEMVNLHGEMVLLENYSAINYTGLAKILKKYDKKTGALIRLPFIQRVLKQPFFNIDLLNKLVKDCELMLDSLLPTSDPYGGQEPKPTSEEVGFLKGWKEFVEMRRVVYALQGLVEIRSGSSTVGVFSLPPLQTNVLEDSWNRIPVLEQEAK